ncbi:MAG TPA: hypothetical protein VFM73_09385, partial [Xanthomonadaceae bacterium]|nr:hypothetical protein [Xanthomonadaceae bacterium]
MIFPHIPKTGGTTLKSALADTFGARLRLDYSDRPLSHAGPVRKAMALWAMRTAPGPDAFDCVYGHFLPVKYSRVPGAVFVTWLRDP